MDSEVAKLGDGMKGAPKRVKWMEYRPESKPCPDVGDIWGELLTNSVVEENSNLEEFGSVADRVVECIGRTPKSDRKVGQRESITPSTANPSPFGDYMASQGGIFLEEESKIGEAVEQGIAEVGLREIVDNGLVETFSSDSSSSSDEGTPRGGFGEYLETGPGKEGMLNLVSVLSAGVPLFQLPTHELPPPAPGKKTLLLDLDLTLIYSFAQGGALPDDIPVLFTRKLNIPFVLRPGATRFVRELSCHAEIILYSSGTTDYIREIVDRVPAFSQSIHHILSRDHCLVFRQGYLKSANVKGRRMEDIIIVDDSFWVYPNDLDNLIPVIPFNVNIYEQDNHLLSILPYVLSLMTQKDVRNSIKTEFHISTTAKQFLKSLGNNQLLV